MKKRPMLRLKRNGTDRILDGIIGLTMVGIWLVSYWLYKNSSTPSQANTTLELPTGSTLLLFFMILLTRAPHILTYTATITTENALQEYTKAARTLRIVTLIVGLIYLSIVISRTGWL